MDGRRHHARSEGQDDARAEQKEEVGGREDVVHLSTCVKIMDVPRVLWTMFSTDGDKAVLRQQYVSKVHTLIKNRIPAFADSRAASGRMGTAFRPTGILNGHFKYKKIETP